MNLRANSYRDLLQLDETTQKRWLAQMVRANRILARRAQRSAQTSWLLQMVCANRALARQARQYIIEKDAIDYPNYLQVLKLIRHAEIFSARTNVTNLRTAFLKACAAAGIEKTSGSRKNIAPGQRRGGSSLSPAAKDAAAKERQGSPSLFYEDNSPASRWDHPQRLVTLQPPQKKLPASATDSAPCTSGYRHGMPTPFPRPRI